MAPPKELTSPYVRVMRSILSGEMDEFIAYMRSLGRRYDVEGKTLARLDDYLVAREENSSC